MLFATIIENLTKEESMQFTEKIRIEDVTNRIQGETPEIIILGLCKLYVALREKEIGGKEHTFDYILKDGDFQKPHIDCNTDRDFEIINFLFTPKEGSDLTPRLYTVGLQLFYILLSRGAIIKENKKDVMQKIGERIREFHGKDKKIWEIIEVSLKTSKVMKSRPLETRNAIFTNCRNEILTLFYEDLQKELEKYRKFMVNIESLAPFIDYYEMENQYSTILIWIYKELIQESVKQFAAFYTELNKLNEDDKPITYREKCEEYVAKNIVPNSTAIALAGYMFPPEKQSDKTQLLLDTQLYLAELVIICQKIHGPLTEKALTLVTYISESTEVFCEMAKKTVFYKGYFSLLDDIVDFINVEIAEVTTMRLYDVNFVFSILGWGNAEHQISS